MMVVLASFIWGWHGSFPGSGLLVVVFYFGLGALRHARRRETPALLGLGFNNGRAAFRNVSGVVLPAAILVLATGAMLDSWHFPPWQRLFVALPWMLIWATVQQYGLLCFFYRGFLEILERPAAATAAAATTFAGFHAPNGFLMAVTLCAGILACALYHRSQNVIAIGIAHAALSFLLLFSLPVDVTHGLRVGPDYFAAVR